MLYYIFRIVCCSVFNIGFMCEAFEHTNPQYTTRQKMDTVTKEEAFARKVFDCLKVNDKNAWLALYPTSREYKALLQKMVALKKDGLTQTQADEMAAQQQRNVAQYGSDEFEGLQREAKAVGLLWAKVAYTGFTFETGASPIGNHYLQGDVWLKTGNTEYVIEKVEAIETAGGYRLQNVASVRKLGDAY